MEPQTASLASESQPDFALLPWPPSRASLRDLLEAVLRDHGELRRFYLDYLPEDISRRVRNLSDPVASLNLLFECTTTQEILERLIEMTPQQVWKHRDLLRPDGKQRAAFAWTATHQTPAGPAPTPKPEEPPSQPTAKVVKVEKEITARSAARESRASGAKTWARRYRLASLLLGGGLVGLLAGTLSYLWGGAAAPRPQSGKESLTVTASNTAVEAELTAEILRALTTAQTDAGRCPALDAAEIGGGTVRLSFSIRRQDRAIDGLSIDSPSPSIRRCVERMIERADFSALHLKATVEVVYQLR